MGISLTEPKLQLLKEINGSAVHGYDLSQRLDKHGSTIYQHLHQLEDEGYIEGEKDDRRILYSLTEKGQLILKAEQMD